MLLFVYPLPWLILLSDRHCCCFFTHACLTLMSLHRVSHLSVNNPEFVEPALFYTYSVIDLFFLSWANLLFHSCVPSSSGPQCCSVLTNHVHVLCSFSWPQKQAQVQVLVTCKSCMNLFCFKGPFFLCVSIHRGSASSRSVIHLKAPATQFTQTELRALPPLH